MKYFILRNLITIVVFFASSTLFAKDITGCWNATSVEIVEYNRLTGEVLSTRKLNDRQLERILDKNLSKIIIVSLCLGDDGAIVTTQNKKMYVGSFVLNQTQLSLEATSMEEEDHTKWEFSMMENEEGIALTEDYYFETPQGDLGKSKIVIKMQQ